ncbi:type II secretion system protein [Mesobacillus jeotgali]|uniref:Type II secretion system protein n=1 Tax=Mesobacillus jeotgali TaxID=129985 RepID=A0ABY9VJK7_9BACI|nr:type II secretion system protein [Mesobacillus jeotgali]WNF21887.1 type II secretion system protein [Mesobacillus jeotgali]
MLKAIKKKMKDQRGLTLVELLAVIVILGIIAAIAVPSIGNVIQKSKVDAVKADALNVLNAGKLYLAAVGEDNDGTISSTELAPYFENGKLTNVSITINANNKLGLNATGTAGKITITYTNSPIEVVNNDAKYTGTEAAPNTYAIGSTN